jgi:biopolymer transport protein ExbD
MADVQEKEKGGKKQGIVIKGKKLSTRIDMTPMVDLAFLLLTFFLLATTFIKPQVMQLVLPEKNQDTSNQPKVNEKNVMSIVLDANNKIYWYVGLTTAQVHETTYKSDGLRKILVDQVKPNDKMVVLVKPSDTSTYENLVDTLDELTINEVSRYVLDKYSDDDKALIQAFTGGGATPAAGT